MKLLGVLNVICMMKILHFKGNQKEHYQDNTRGDGKERCIFPHTPVFLKKKTASSTTWASFSQKTIIFQNQRVLKKNVTRGSFYILL